MIAVECNADETLVRTLGIRKHAIVHCRGKAEVIKKLTKGQAVGGMVDEDPASIPPGYMREFEQLEVDTHNDLRWYGYHDRRLVVLSPRLEEWVIERAKRVNVLLREYKLPNDADRLHDRIASEVHQAKFEDLLLAMIDRGEEGLRTIERLLRASRERGTSIRDHGR